MSAPLPPPNILNNPSALNRWVARLSPQSRAEFEQYVSDLIQRLPPKRKQVFEQVITSKKKTGRIPASIQGLGLDAASAFSWGDIGSTLATIGVSLYAGKQQQSLQKDLANAQGKTAVELEKIRAQTESSNANIWAKAQQYSAIASSQIHAQADVAKAQALASSLPWIIGGVAIAGVVGLGIYMKMRKKRRS